MDARKIESLWAHVHGLGVLQSAGSFTAAAQRLGLSKAAMSQRIAELERAAGVPLGRQQIVPRLADFLRAHPQVRVELELSDRLVSMAQEGFDVALRHTHAPPDTHVAWPLCPTRSVLVASRAYLRRAGVPARPEDLAVHECLHYLRPGDTPTWA